MEVSGTASDATGAELGPSDDNNTAQHQQKLQVLQVTSPKSGVGGNNNNISTNVNVNASVEGIVGHESSMTLEANGAKQEEPAQDNSADNCNNFYNQLHSVRQKQPDSTHSDLNSRPKSAAISGSQVASEPESEAIAQTMIELLVNVEAKLKRETTVLTPVPSSLPIQITHSTPPLPQPESESAVELPTLSPEECALIIDSVSPPTTDSPPQTEPPTIAGDSHQFAYDHISTAEKQQPAPPPEIESRIHTANTAATTTTDNQCPQKADIATTNEDLDEACQHETDAPTNELMQSPAPDLSTDKQEPDNQQQDELALPPTESQTGSGDTSVQVTTDVEMVVSESSKEVETLEIDPDDLHEEKVKEMVTLRNLEISPPPPAPISAQETSSSRTDEQATGENDTPPTRENKRTRATTSESGSDLNESAESGRSKRRRTQTKLFQVGEAVSVETIPPQAKTTRVPRVPSRSRRKSAASSSTSEANMSNAQDTHVIHANDQQQDVIYYEKNDYLAIRNEENSFYLCQLAENVRVNRPMIKIKWLDTTDDGKTYFLTSHYDKVPQKSIIMPVILNKLKSEKKGEQVFALEDTDKDNIMERLKRSLNVPTEASAGQESSTDG